MEENVVIALGNWSLILKNVYGIILILIYNCTNVFQYIIYLWNDLKRFPFSLTVIINT